MKPAASTLIADRLRQLLSYDADTGIFVWIGGPRPNRMGLVAGGPASSGYLRLMVDGQRYMQHRLAWLHMTGHWPVSEIDHINGNKVDNSFGNLREATRMVNTQNIRSARKDSQSGLLGVSAHGKRWAACIEHSKIRRHIGTFSTPELASAAYLQAKREFHAGCTI